MTLDTPIKVQLEPIHIMNKNTNLGKDGTEYEYIPRSKNKSPPPPNQGRNGTAICHLGATRIFSISTVVNDPDLANITMERMMNHGDVFVFGTELNSGATHAVLPFGIGYRLSLVFEFAVHDAVWKPNNTTTFHDHMGVREGKFTLFPLKNTIKVKQEPIASNVASVVSSQNCENKNIGSN